MTNDEGRTTNDEEALTLFVLSSFVLRHAT